MGTGKELRKELTTVETLPNFKSSTSGECSVQRGVVEACGQEEKHDNSHIAPQPSVKMRH